MGFTKALQTNSWAAMPERGTPALLRLGAWIGVHLGRLTARLLLYPITFYFVISANAARQSSYEYLERIWQRQPRWWHVFRHFHWFAATILDRLYLLRGEFERFEVTFHQREILHRQIESGKGCILLGSHLGSFEVLRALGFSNEKITIKVLMDERNAPLIRELIQKLNPAVADTVIQVGDVDTMLQVRECLERGTLVGIMGDRLMSQGQLVMCDFLGSPAAFPSGVMRLAHAVSTPVVLFFGLYQGGNRYDVHLELLSQTVRLSPERREDDVRQWTQHYADRLAQYSRDAPDNWFNFYDFWQAPQ